MRALQTTCDVYGLDVAELPVLLAQRLDSGVFDDYRSFEDDMQKWFTGEHRVNWTNRDFSSDRLDSARLEIERALNILQPQPAFEAEMGF